MSSVIGGIAGGITSNKIFGGFAPFPNSIMIPFMGAQSAVLGYQFGIHYEMGKRTIKSLPNDFFNNIRAGSDELINVTYNGQEYTMKYVEYLPFLERMQYMQQITGFRNSLPDYQSLQNDIIEESVKIELKKAERTPSAMAEIIEAVYSGIQNLDPDATTTGFLAKLILALTVPGNPFPTTDEFTEFYENYIAPPPDPEPNPDAINIQFVRLNLCDNSSSPIETGPKTFTEHVSSCDSAYYQTYKQGILAGDATCLTETRWQTFLTYVNSIETAFNTPYPNDTTKRH
jgi:hypothetical protein